MLPQRVGRFDSAPGFEAHVLCTRGSADLCVGGADSVGDVRALEARNIQYVVNCCPTTQSHVYHAGARIYVFDLGHSALRGTDEDDTLAFVAPLLEFVCGALRRGHSALVHREEGIQRAGAAGVICLMAVTGCDAHCAISTAHAIRPYIVPVYMWWTLVDMVGKGLAKTSICWAHDVLRDIHRYGWPCAVPIQPPPSMPHNVPTPPPPQRQSCVDARPLTPQGYASGPAVTLPSPHTPRGPALTPPPTLQGRPRSRSPAVRSSGCSAPSNEILSRSGARPKHLPFCAENK